MTLPKSTESPPPQILDRRGGGLAVNLVNDKLLYLINISVDTHPQTLSVHLDTESSDIWVPSLDLSLYRKGACGEAGSCRRASLTSPFSMKFVPHVGDAKTHGSHCLSRSITLMPLPLKLCSLHEIANYCTFSRLV